MRFPGSILYQLSRRPSQKLWSWHNDVTSRMTFLVLSLAEARGFQEVIFYCVPTRGFLSWSIQGLKNLPYSMSLCDTKISISFLFSCIPIHAQWIRLCPAYIWEENWYKVSCILYNPKSTNLILSPSAHSFPLLTFPAFCYRPSEPFPNVAKICRAINLDFIF